MEAGTEALEVFERHRPRLFGLSYRMLGSVEDAEDLVQEAYVRWHQSDAGEVRSPEAWLVAVTTRMAIDRQQATEQGSDLSVAFLLLLERLGPEERAAFLLREVFDTEYTEIARVLERSEPAVRQMVHRARTRLREGRARYTPPPGAKERLLERFVAALRSDDRDGLLALFADDAVLIGDGGGKAAASPRPIVGADRIAHLMLTVYRKSAGRRTQRLARLNGEPALVVEQDGRVVAALSLETDGERIVACYSVLNPDKLRRL